MEQFLLQNETAKDGPFYEASFVFWFCFGWLGPCCQKSVPGSRRLSEVWSGSFRVDLGTVLGPFRAPTGPSSGPPRHTPLRARRRLPCPLVLRRNLPSGRPSARKTDFLWGPRGRPDPRIEAPSHCMLRNNINIIMKTLF